MNRLCSMIVLTMTLGGSMANAQSADELINDTVTPGDVLTYGMGYGQQRYSSLDQISVDTVSGLVPVWAYSLDDSRGQESFPLVKDGVMYVTTHAATIAVDAATGKQIWKTTVEYPPETPRAACCGIVNRGAAIYEGKLFRTTLDANVIALDMATGSEIWRTNSIDFKAGYSFTVAPLVADGVVIVGISGGEYGIRGY
ncbi:MAG: PQQ-binding-like beta-propeller repeat protein, partial [Pseudomonadota bacterium]